MKKLLTFLTVLAALSGPVLAEGQSAWFDGGIGENWPTNAAMFGGAWCDEAEARGHMAADNSALKISTEEDAPLSFDATYPKALGDAAAARDVVVTFSCAFQPFSAKALPEVPDDAKGAVILVAEDVDSDVAEEGVLYYAAWDDAQGKNLWKPSAALATTGKVCQISMTIRRGSATGFLAVDYILSDGDQAMNIPLRQADAVSSGMYFTGAGQATGLAATYEPGVSHTLNVVPVTGLSVTNVTANGISVGSGYGTYFVSDGADVVVYYAAAPGYAMKGDGVVGIGRVTQDTTVDRDHYTLPEVEALGKYLIGSTIYTSFEDMIAALKDGDTVEMLMDDTLPSGAELAKRITFCAGEYVLSAPSGDFLTIAADVVFTATAATNLPPFFIRADCTLTLPSGTAFEDYSLTGEDYARVRIDGNEWVFYDDEWHTAGFVTMRFYYPGYFDREALTLGGSFGRPIKDGSVDGFVENVCYTNFVQDFYWDDETEMMIDDVYWFDGTWSDAGGNEVEFPTRYAAGDFYPNSTAIVFKITYDMGGVSGAENPNPTGYTIETPRFELGAASVSGFAFLGWKDEDGNDVTEVDPVALGRETGYLYGIGLFATWGPTTSASKKLKMSAAVSPGKTAAYYDTDEQAQTAAAALNADEEGGVLPPAKFTGDRAAYSANFKATANGSTVAVNLTEDAKENIAKKVDGATLSAAAGLTDPSVSTVTIKDAEPGFYYSVIGMTAADGVETEGDRKLAQETTVELKKPDLGKAGNAFYKIKAAVK